MEENISKRLRMLRKAKGLSVSKLAELIGKNRATVYRWENGEIENLPLDSIAPIADALGCTPADLVGWVDNEPVVIEINEITQDFSEEEMKRLMSYAKFIKAERGESK